MKEINECPLCGKIITEEETLCNDCKLYSQNQNYTDFLNDVEYSDTCILDRDIVPDESQSEEYQSSSSLKDKEENEPEIQHNSIVKESVVPDKEEKTEMSKVLIFYLLGCLLVVFLGIWGIYNVLDAKKLGETEDVYWELCAVENTPTAYAKYLVRFSDGKFEEIAHQRIRELRNKEIADWNELQQASDINDYYLFILNNPHTPYMAIIKAKIDSLVWDKTVQEGTPEAYQAYLENVGLDNVEGAYRDQAQYRYDYLSQIKRLEQDNLDSLYTQLNLFYQALGKMDKEQLEESLSSTFYYYGNQLTYTSFVNIIKNSYKDNNITQVIYHPVDSEIEAFIDNKGFVFVNLIVDREMTTSVVRVKDGKKGRKEIDKSIRKDTMQLEINSNGKIVSIDRRQDAPLFGLKKRDTK